MVRGSRKEGADVLGVMGEMTRSSMGRPSTGRSSMERFSIFDMLMAGSSVAGAALIGFPGSWITFNASKPRVKETGKANR